MNRFAMVTGADRGLGLALAEALASDGYRVYAGSYLPEWPELREAKRKFPGRITALPLDVTDNASVEAAANAVRAETDVMHVLINNAGQVQDRSGTILDPLFDEDVARLYDVNAIGPLRVTHAFLPLLLNAKEKTVVYISSVAGSHELVVRTHQYGYTMSKAALNMQAKLLHNHLHKQGLRVLAVHPGWMRTHLFGDLNRMKDAPFEPKQSAANIVRLIKTHVVQHDKIFLDHEGNELPW